MFFSVSTVLSTFPFCNENRASVKNYPLEVRHVEGATAAFKQVGP